MKNKGNTRSARTTAKKIHIRQGGRDLTAQADLIQESSVSDHTEYLISLHTLGESTKVKQFSQIKELSKYGNIAEKS